MTILPFGSPAFRSSTDAQADPWLCALALRRVCRFEVLVANHIADVLRRTGKPVEALTEYGMALAINQKLADADPSVTHFQSSLAESHNSLGIVLRMTGKPEEAI